MIKAKYTLGEVSKEFEFNSMAELLEYERADRGVVIDCADMTHEQVKEAIKEFNKSVDWGSELAKALRASLEPQGYSTRPRFYI